MPLVIRPTYVRYLFFSIAFGVGVGCRAPGPATEPTGYLVTIADERAFVDHTLMTLRRNFFVPEYVDAARGLIVSRPETSKQWFEFWRPDVPAGYQLLESSLHTMRRRVTVSFTPTGVGAARVAGTVEAAQQPPQMQPMRPVPPSGKRPTLSTAAGPPNAIMQPTHQGAPASVPAATKPSPPPPLRSSAPMQQKASAPPVRPAPTRPSRPPQPQQYRLTVTVDKERYSAPERQVTTVTGALGIYSERLPTTEGIRASRSESEHWVPLGRDAALERKLLSQITKGAVVSARSALPAGT